MHAMKRQLDAAFLICLTLSVLGPCNARRLSATSDLVTAEQWWWSSPSCPKGLQLELKDNKTLNKSSGVCSYDEQVAQYGPASSLFNTSSEAKLLFNATTGGTFLTTAQFTSELVAAFMDRNAMYRVGSSLAEVEMKRNATFEKLVTEQMAHKHSDFHKFEENLQVGFFVVEHVLEHLAVEGLEVGFHALAHAAEHGAALELAALGGSGVAAFVLEYVFPVLLPIQTIGLIWSVRSHLKERTHHAKNFTSHLVLKSDCMRMKLENAASSMKLQPVIGKVCSARFQSDLEDQIRAVNQAKIELLDTLASLGRCTWPHGNRAWSKINCVETMYYSLLQSEGQAGILYGALAFMAYYGFRLDELGNEPVFDDFYEREFGIKKQADAISLLPKIQDAETKPLEERWPICMQLLATHRAFESTFRRLNSAIKVWMRSFARELVEPSIRTSWKPCRRVFNKIWDETQEGFCKNFDWKIGHGRDEKPIDENMACEQTDEFTGSLWPETEVSHNESESSSSHH